MKKLHLNRIGNSIFAKNFLSYLENNWFSESVRDDIVSKDASNVYNDYTPDPKQVLKNIRISIVKGTLMQIWKSPHMFKFM